MANEDKVHIGHVHFVPDTNPIPAPAITLLFGSGIAEPPLWRYRKSVKG
ncbi:MAG: hypothetical protein V3T42_13100 [Nitrospirales bacterium]